MRHFSVFTAPYYSFFSRALFADVGRRWGAKTFAYLLLLLALSWIPFMFDMRSAWSAFLSDVAPALIRQIPPISIESGRVSADVEQPHFIRTSGSDKVVAIIDTTGQTRSLDGTSATLLLTDSQLITKTSNTQTRTYDLSGIKTFSLDGPTIEKWLPVFGTWGIILLYPVSVIGNPSQRKPGQLAGFQGLLRALTFQGLIGVRCLSLLLIATPRPCHLRDDRSSQHS